MKPSHRLSLIVPVIAGLLLAGAPAHAADEKREHEARELFARGSFSQAVDIYAQLYAETPHPTYVRNIGRCYQAMGDPERAIAAFREYLRRAPDISARDRSETEGFIREMEELKARRQREDAARVTPPTASSAALGGTPPPAYVSGGADAAAPKSGRSWWVWGGIGGALVAAGVVTAVILAGQSAQPMEPMTSLGIRDAFRR